MPQAYLALGSNLGDRLALLRAAVRALGDTPGVRVTRRSPIYETDAVADEPQPAYLNAAIEIETDLAPRALLDLCLEIERALGRQRPAAPHKASRLIDIDVLLYGELTVDETDLGIPHRAFLERPFVRIPLADIAAPGLRHPVTGEVLDGCPPDPGVRLFASGL